MCKSLLLSWCSSSCHSLQDDHCMFHHFLTPQATTKKWLGIICPFLKWMIWHEPAITEGLGKSDKDRLKAEEFSFKLTQSRSDSAQPMLENGC